MTKGEMIAGYVYLPFFYGITAILIVYVLSIFGKGDEIALVNLVFNYVNFAFIAVAFHKYLANSLYAFGKKIWNSLQAVILSVALWLALSVVVGFILSFIFGEFSNPNDDLVRDIAGLSRKTIIVCACILAPFVEETLFRGVVFGSIHRKNRFAAYVVSFLLFGGTHIWQFALEEPSWFLLINLLEYIPASIALGWAYEKGDNIFCPIILHAAVNCISVFQLI